MALLSEIIGQEFDGDSNMIYRMENTRRAFEAALKCQSAGPWALRWYVPVQADLTVASLLCAGFG